MTNQSSVRPLAVVTGASSGIGYELAAQFAANGFDVAVVANSDRLSSAVRILRGQHPVQILPVRADLATEAGVQQLYVELRRMDRPIEAIALNAGVGVYGPFAETALEDDMNLIDLNVRSTVYLAKLLIRDMVQRGNGKVLFTSSIASTMPGTFTATYNASKAFIQSFAQAIRNELKDTGVSVTSLMPGPTETDFFRRAGEEDTKVGQGEKDDAGEVAREGFQALMDGKDHVIAGSFKNKVQATMAHVLPDTMLAEKHRNTVAPQPKDH